MRKNEDKLNVLMQNRILWLDLARCFAIVVVVLTHINESISYSQVYLGEIRVSINSWFFQNSIHTIGRLGVPVFLMISGGMVLKRDIEDPLIFYKNKLFPLVTATISWILIYNLFNLIYFKQEISIVNIIKEILTGQIVSSNQLWYMSVIIGLYIAAPFISIMVNKLSTKSLIIFILIGSVYYLLLPIINIYTLNNQRFLNLFPIYSAIDMGFMGGAYGLYFIMGYMLINRKILVYISSRVILCIFTITFLGVSLLQYELYNLEIPYGDGYLWYSSIFVAILAICIFEGIKRVEIKIPKKIYIPIIKISQNSFGIYLVHSIYVSMLKDYFKQVQWMVSIKEVTMFSIVFIFSYITVGVIKKIPIINKYIINYKHARIK